MGISAPLGINISFDNTTFDVSDAMFIAPQVAVKLLPLIAELVDVKLLPLIAELVAVTPLMFIAELVAVMPLTDACETLPCGV